MGKRETSNISHPWDPKKTSATGLRCPKCGNDGMDGSITGTSVQYGLIRKCLKCNFRWAGGIGVQQADFTQPMPQEGVDTTGDDRPTQRRVPGFRDPSKNTDYGEE